MFQETDLVLKNESFPSKILTNNSKRGIYLGKIPTVITETLIV